MYIVGAVKRYRIAGIANGGVVHAHIRAFFYTYPGACCGIAGDIIYIAFGHPCSGRILQIQSVTLTFAPIIFFLTCKSVDAAMDIEKYIVMQRNFHCVY